MRVDLVPRGLLLHEPGEGAEVLLRIVPLGEDHCQIGLQINSARASKRSALPATVAILSSRSNVAILAHAF